MLKLQHRSRTLRSTIGLTLDLDNDLGRCLTTPAIPAMPESEVKTSL